MPRPQKERKVEQIPPVTHYKPAGIRLRDIDEVVLTIEEMEAIRLADVEQLDQSAAADRMEVSKPTFNRIVNRAHQKIAQALWMGKALRFEGGNFRIVHQHRHGCRHFRCQNCSHEWTEPHGAGPGWQMRCAKCNSDQVTRTN